MDVTQQPDTRTATQVAAINVRANRKVVMLETRSLREQSARSAFSKEGTRQTATHKRSSATRRVAQVFSADSRREAESVPAVPASQSVPRGEASLNRSRLPVRQTRPTRQGGVSEPASGACKAPGGLSCERALKNQPVHTGRPPVLKHTHKEISLALSRRELSLSPTKPRAGASIPVGITCREYEPQSVPDARSVRDTGPTISNSYTSHGRR